MAKNIYGPAIAKNILSPPMTKQVLQYTSFPIIRVNKFLKAQATQLVQSPSHLSCQMSKFPKLSKPKLLKVQVTQSSSHPKLKLPKVQVAQIAKSPRGPQVKNLIALPWPSIFMVLQ